jgi:peptide/nickel transport system substrate-binding protein
MTSTTRTHGRGRYAAVLGIVAVVALAACGKDAADPTTSAAVTTASNTGDTGDTGDDSSGADTGETGIAGVPAGADTILTAAPSGEADSAVWAVYRETATLDPLFGFDYPDNTALAVACESLLRQGPDLTIGPGLASSAEYTGDTSLVLTLRDDVTFWDGAPLTAADVVFSLARQRDPANGGFYSAVFANVTDIAATGDLEVTITTTGRDMLLLSELAGPTGVVTQQAYVESKGADYGTSAGGIMCTGPFQLSSWVIGEGVTFERFDGYWDDSLPRQLKTLTIRGVPDEAALTAGLLTGEIDGTYTLGISTLDQLRQSDEVTVSEGPGYAIAAFIVSSFEGALADVRVRQAVSMAIDRQGLATQLYKGAAYPSRAVGVPGMWGYATDTFVEGWNALPDVSTPDLEAAKQLVKDAGAEGQTIRLGMSGEIAALATQAGEFQRAIESIGMKAELVSVSAANYINFFIDPAAREGVDGFFTVNYSNTADPLSLYVTLIGPDGSQAYNGYADPAAIELLQSARSEPDDTARAEQVVQLQALVTDQMLWIPIVAPNTTLVMSADVTGAPATFQHMFGPWAAYLGAA